MNSDPEFVPTGDEALSQLDRMLSSSHFERAARQSAFLSFVVRQSLNGNEISEADIGYAVFDNYDPATHNVRATGSIVRGKIEDYYSSDGAEDLVIIRLPPGKAYRVSVSYRINEPSLRHYKRGLALLGQCPSYDKLENAKWRFMGQRASGKRLPLLMPRAAKRLSGSQFYPKFTAIATLAKT